MRGETGAADKLLDLAPEYATDKTIVTGVKIGFRHWKTPRRQGAGDRALTRPGYGASSDASSQRGRTENA